MVDLGAAEHAYGAVMKALYQRAVTGKGSRIDISMFHSAVAWMANPVMLTGLGEKITRRGNTHQYFGPVAVFPTRDGYLYLAIGNDRQWAALTQQPPFESLARPEYERNAGRMSDLAHLYELMAERTRRLDSEELLALLKSIAVPAARVNTLSRSARCSPSPCWIPPWYVRAMCRVAVKFFCRRRRTSARPARPSSRTRRVSVSTTHISTANCLGIPSPS
jgi:crotonobetainyl-CoA:carnitine CoA-transferase CaiB-like acyl-CoA transferase